ncbi:uncharacterized protein AC631_04967 [Debaryomyces fabryi]|uniref:HORMA domain-containing protein n=1 Tax=Debaryomyces fabryi TaxID=58627 RepID=A0A0V1PTA1_9ASCO|nr:uncharacterized protein AC631_04967 [Debaryomyces fabryi]KRZ99275.1 hypothetical protein AC631_04967 [Debaryomyces fabryi]CUM51462.1 unnamed protein product [Debaryomyces fabryi]
MSLPLTLPYVILTLKEFMIVWVNQVLYYNEIYPSEIYDKLKSFDIIVYQSRNPALNKYVEDLVNEFLLILVNGDGHTNGGKVNQMLLLLYDVKSNKTKKKYVAKFNEMINLAPSVNDLNFLHLIDEKDSKSLLEPVIDVPNFTWDEIYSQLRSILFSQIEELKSPNNELEKDDLFFKVILDLEDSIDLNVNFNSETNSQHSNWVKLSTTSADKQKRKTKVVPIGEVSVGFICIDMYNEYSKRVNA